MKKVLLPFFIQSDKLTSDTQMSIDATLTLRYNDTKETVKELAQLTFADLDGNRTDPTYNEGIKLGSGFTECYIREDHKLDKTAIISSGNTYYRAEAGCETDNTNVDERWFVSTYMQNGVGKITWYGPYNQCGTELGAQYKGYPEWDAPTKTINGSTSATIRSNEKATFEISQFLPYTAQTNQAKSVVIEDTLPDIFDMSRTQVRIEKRNGENIEDVSKDWNIEVKGHTIKAAAKVAYNSLGQHTLVIETYPKISLDGVSSTPGADGSITVQNTAKTTINDTPKLSNAATVKISPHATIAVKTSIADDDAAFVAEYPSTYPMSLLYGVYADEDCQVLLDKFYVDNGDTTVSGITEFGTYYIKRIASQEECHYYDNDPQVHKLEVSFSSISASGTGTLVVEETLVPIRYTATWIDTLTGEVLSQEEVPHHGSTYMVEVPRHRGHHFLGFNRDDIADFTEDRTFELNYADYLYEFPQDEHSVANAMTMAHPERIYASYLWTQPVHDNDLLPDDFYVVYADKAGVLHHLPAGSYTISPDVIPDGMSGEFCVKIEHITDEGEVLECEVVLNVEVPNNSYAAVYTDNTLVFGHKKYNEEIPATYKDATLVEGWENIENVSLYHQEGEQLEPNGIMRPIYASDCPWASYANTITQSDIIGKISPLDTSFWFHNMRYLTHIDHIENLDTSNTTNMINMFYQCESIAYIGLETFKMEKVQSIEGMLFNCEALIDKGMEKWNTQSLVYMDFFMQRTVSISGRLDLSGWTTDNLISARAALSGKRQYETQLTEISLSGWNTEKLTNIIDFLSWREKMTKVDMTGWTTPSMINMRGCFLRRYFFGSYRGRYRTMGYEQS